MDAVQYMMNPFLHLVIVTFTGSDFHLKLRKNSWRFSKGNGMNLCQQAHRQLLGNFVPEEKSPDIMVISFLRFS
jgi:hypothetical protein